MCSVESVIVRNQLRWSGHVVRMENNRLPKQMFYSELTEGKRDVGGQKKRFKDRLKSHLNQCAIDTKEWENLAMNRTIWRKAIRDGVEKFEERRSEGIRLKRERKKERQEQPRTELPPGLCCPECGRQFQGSYWPSQPLQNSPSVNDVNWTPIFYTEGEPTTKWHIYFCKTEAWTWAEIINHVNVIIWLKVEFWKGLPPATLPIRTSITCFFTWSMWSNATPPFKPCMLKGFFD